MNIDTQTLAVLKNFSTINPSILFKTGNVLKTISSNKTVMAKAKVPTDFPKEFAIYNLNRFISALSLFDKPDLSFEDSWVKIAEGKRNSKYVYASVDTLKVTPPEKDVNLPSKDVSFTLTQDALAAVQKAAGIFDLDEYHVVGDGKTIQIQANTSKEPTGDVFTVDLGETDKTFKAIFLISNISFIPGDYQVDVCSKGIAHFAGTDVEYWVAVEANSVF